MKFFDIIFLEEAHDFIEKQKAKTQSKILYNIERAQLKNDSELFKKLKDEIWEFRTLHDGKQIRLLAFWDNRNNKNTLVIITHGFIKKTHRIASKEIDRASTIRKQYLLTEKSN